MLLSPSGVEGHAEPRAVCRANPTLCLTGCAIGHAQSSHYSTSGGRPSVQAPIAAISACFFFRALQTKNTKSTSMVSSSPPNTCRCTSMRVREDGWCPLSTTRLQHSTTAAQPLTVRSRNGKRTVAKETPSGSLGLDDTSRSSKSSSFASAFCPPPPPPPPPFLPFLPLFFFFFFFFPPPPPPSPSSAPAAAAAAPPPSAVPHQTRAQYSKGNISVFECSAR